MKHPPYHLRPNKAVDRLMLIEVIKRLERIGRLEEYTYYGLGGPYLEDFRLIYDFFPNIKMVSIEENKETFKRQAFHLPCGSVRLECEHFGTYLNQFDPKDEKSIFWLDYTDLNIDAIHEFQLLLEKLAADSVVKVTLRSEPRDYINEYTSEDFRSQFGDIMPDALANPPRIEKDYAKLVQDMLQIAAEQTLGATLDNIFQPLSSFFYKDSVGMFTLTGIICKREEKMRIRKVFGDLQFTCFNWRKPKKIDVPILSTKERLQLQQHLPCKSYAGKQLQKILGYYIDDDIYSSSRKLDQYADFHRYFPYFIKAIP